MFNIDVLQSVYKHECKNLKDLLYIFDTVGKEILACKVLSIPLLTFLPLFHSIHALPNHLITLLQASFTCQTLFL